MKTITITVDIDGNKITREYKADIFTGVGADWDYQVEDMLETIEKSKEVKF